MAQEDMSEGQWLGPTGMRLGRSPRLRELTVTATDMEHALALELQAAMRRMAR